MAAKMASKIGQIEENVVFNFYLMSNMLELGKY